MHKELLHCNVLSWCIHMPISNLCRKYHCLFSSFQDLLSDQWAKEFASENTVPSDAEFWDKLQKSWEELAQEDEAGEHSWLSDFNTHVKDPVSVLIFFICVYYHYLTNISRRLQIQVYHRAKCGAIAEYSPVLQKTALSQTKTLTLMYVNKTLTQVCQLRASVGCISQLRPK